MAKSYVLSESDVLMLRDMAAWFRKNVAGRSPSTVQGFRVNQAPDTYVAVPPEGGIPARVGTEPGMAECDIYRITYDGNLEEVGTSRYVYNLTSTDVNEDYVPVTRTKSGTWIVVPPGCCHYKQLCHFVLLEDLTIEMEQADAYISVEYGEGISHLGESGDTGTGTGTDSRVEIVVHNMLTSSGDYEFYGDEGDHGIAFFDQYEDGVGHWIIVMLECP